MLDERICCLSEKRCHGEQAAHRPEIAESQIYGAAVAGHGQQSADRDAGQKDDLGHQKQQSEQDEQDNVEELHIASG